jgi:hypothetical protein
MPTSLVGLSSAVLAARAALAFSDRRRFSKSSYDTTTTFYDRIDLSTG